MKTRILIILLIVSNFSFAGIENLLPKPKLAEKLRGTPFNFTDVKIQSPVLEQEIKLWIEQELGGSVSQTNFDKVISIELVNNIENAEFQEEAYFLEVIYNKITIKATTYAGAFYAFQTLKQLTEGKEAESCRITDWPAFRVRGFMHDVGRSYMEFTELKKHIELLSHYKINVFHWHLTENQGWRLESKVFPQLNATSNFTRHAGKYYTIAQAKELVQWAKKHAVTVIPEIDMPGHSDAFTRAFGYTMQTTQGLATLKTLMTEICDIFNETEWMHIGTDEVTITMPNFVPEMVAHIRSKGKKVVSWNPGYDYKTGEIDMVQMWSSRGRPLAGTPTIDSRYHYINHFDQFADIVGIYNSSIAEQQKGSHQYAGVIMGIWNDRITKSDRDIVIQNAFYQSMLAIAERAWMGGGTYITSKGTMLDMPHTSAFQEFADWERRFLHYKATHLKNEPIAYVKQTNVIWKITDAFPNNGTLTTIFPPETEIADSYTYNDKTYNTRIAIGAGIYLRHVWGTTIPTFFSNPSTNSTAYAYTYVYSPVNQTAGAFIEFQNYGRSESDVPARQGKWDYKESRIWLNDTEILPPTWESQHTTRNNETPLTNENYSARTPVQVQLKQGWNKVFIKLPVGSFSISQVRLVKWMFTFVLTTPDGKSELDNIIYFPTKNTLPSKEFLSIAINDASFFLNEAKTGNQPGEYTPVVKSVFAEAIQKATTTLNTSQNEDELQNALNNLSASFAIFKKHINMPEESTSGKIIWYTLHTPFRENRYLTYQGDNANLKGEVYQVGKNKQMWKLEKLDDGTYNIVNRYENSCILNDAAYNTALKASTTKLESGGWQIIPTYTDKTFIITSGSVQMNQTNSGLGYNIYNWGGGTNLTDTGCRYYITEVERTTATENPTFIDNIKVWVKNRKVFFSGNEQEPVMYNTNGRIVSLNQTLEPGMYFLRFGNVTKKIIVT